ncbi:hypothetical protein C8R46DRAFT_1087520 [Mycena filopes]|nr:hypothetical protein C8R46DRAFT_1087520 [Mycena filopes]
MTSSAFTAARSPLSVLAPIRGALSAPAPSCSRCSQTARRATAIPTQSTSRKATPAPRLTPSPSTQFGAFGPRLSPPAHSPSPALIHAVIESVSMMISLSLRITVRYPRRPHQHPHPHPARRLIIAERALAAKLRKQGGSKTPKRGSVVLEDERRADMIRR